MTANLIYDNHLWDRFVDNSPHALLFHRWDYLKIVEKHTGYKLLPYGVYAGEELICIFPLFYKNYFGLKMLFSPPPRICLPYLGFVMSPVYDTLKERKKESYLNDVVKEINKVIAILSAGYISISTVPGYMDARPFKWTNFDVNLNYTYRIDLDRNVNEIWDGFSKDCRQRIKSINKLDVRLEESKDIDHFYRLMYNTYHQQGLNSPLLSSNYLKDVLSTFPDNIKLYYLYVNDGITDAELVYSYKGNMKLWLGGMTIHKTLQGNQEYSTWELIKKAKAEEYKEFEIVGANTKRLCKYQSKFNPSTCMFLSMDRKGMTGKAAELFYKHMIVRNPALSILKT